MLIAAVFRISENAFLGAFRKGELGCGKYAFPIVQSRPTAQHLLPAPQSGCSVLTLFAVPMEVMDLSNYYGVALLCVLGLLVLRRSFCYLRVAGHIFTKPIRLAVLVPRGSWSSINVTFWKASALSAFIAGNAIVLVFVDARKSLATISIMNMVPLYLGGRTNVFIDALDVPLHTYYFSHYWLGRIFIVQALAHAGIKLSIHTLALADPSGVLGFVATIITVLLLVTSVPWFRRRSYLVFAWLHFFFSLGCLGSILGHIYFVPRPIASLTSLLCLASGCLMCLSAIYCFVRMVCFGRAEVVRSEAAGSALQIWIRARHSIKTQPGTYFYISFLNIPLRFKSQNSMRLVIFWNSNDRGTTREFSFFLCDSNPVAKAVGHLLQKEHTLKVKLDGPYGKELQLKDYGLVMLLAEGAGIAGLLPFALSLLFRRKHDADDKAQKLRNRLYCD